jgi:hypothetical protein
MERVSLIVTGLISFTGIYFDAPQTFYGLKAIVIIVAVAANWIFVSIWIYQYWLNYRTNNTDKARIDPKFRDSMNSLVRNSPLYSKFFVDREELAKITNREDTTVKPSIANSPKETQAFKVNNQEIEMPVFKIYDEPTNKSKGEIPMPELPNRDSVLSPKYGLELSMKDRVDTSPQNRTNNNNSKNDDQHHLSKVIEIMDWNAQDHRDKEL